MAEELTAYRGRSDTIVLGLPRGGVPVAYEVAKRLELPLDVFVVRKLGVPGYEELAMGAIASGNVIVLNDDVMRALPNSEGILETVRAREKIELERRESALSTGRRSVGLARSRCHLWWTMAWRRERRCAPPLRRCGSKASRKSWLQFRWAHRRRAAKSKRRWMKRFARLRQTYFHGVGQFYKDFSQTTDEEVRELLAKAKDQSM